METHITREYLRENRTEIFVFGDNDLRKGNGGAAVLRDEPNTYGFITKKFPKYADDAYYRVTEYESVYRHEINKLKVLLERHKDKIYLISKLGAGLANKYGIWEQVIEPQLRNDLKNYTNVKFLW